MDGSENKLVPKHHCLSRVHLSCYHNSSPEVQLDVSDCRSDSLRIRRNCTVGDGASLSTVHSAHECH